MTLILNCIDCGKEIAYKRKPRKEPVCRSCITQRGWSPLRREAMAKRMKKERADPDSVFNSDEARRKLSEAQKANWADPDSTYNTAEFRAVTGMRSREMWANPNSTVNQPEHRERMSQCARALWTDLDSTYNSDEFRMLLSQRKREWHARLMGKDPADSQECERTFGWAADVKERDNWTCQECSATDRLHAHHVKHRAYHPELAHDVSNGITLCVVCHAQKHPHVGFLQEQAARAKEARKIV